MKESRIIIFVLIIIMILLLPFIYFLPLCGVSKDLTINIITNFECGVTVGLVTAICQYYAAKNRIVNTVYSLYFDLYRTYYIVKNNVHFFHYNTQDVFKKLTEISPKLNETLAEYHGIFVKKDFTYKKINPNQDIPEQLNLKNVKRAFYKINNGKPFDETVGKFMELVVKILKDIDRKRFELDEKQMIALFKSISE